MHPLLQMALASTALGLMAWPALVGLAPRQGLALWPLARVVGLCLAGVAAVPLAMFGQALGGGDVVRPGWLVFAALALPGWVLLAKSVRDNRAAWLVRARQGWKLALYGEFIFWAALAAYAWYLPFNPSIDPDSERYVGASLLGHFAAFPHWPPLDPWMAGQPANYYHFGYWMLGIPMRLTGLELGAAFLPALTLVWALSAQMAAGLGAWLTRRLWAGLLCVFLVLLASNPDAWQRAQDAESVRSYDWFGPARVIDDDPAASPGSKGEVITEFPMFSVVYGDLHPYVVALPFTLAAFWLLALALRSADGRTRALRLCLRVPARQVVALGLAIAVLSAAHLWNALFFGGVMAGMFTLLLITRFSGKRAEAHPMAWAELADWLLVAVLGVALSKLLLGGFDQAGRPLGVVQVPSDAAEMIRLLGWHFALLLGWLALCWRQRWLHPAQDLPRWLTYAPLALGAVLGLAGLMRGGGASLLGLFIGLLTPLLLLRRARALPPPVWFGLALVLASLMASFSLELVFVQDMFSGALERMNTVFKIHFLVWIALGVALTALVGGLPIRRMIRRRHNEGLGLLALLLAVLWGSSAYLQNAPAARSRDFSAAKSWDADTALERTRPADKAAIDWLRGQRQRPLVILEASHDASRQQPSYSYNWHGRFSTFSGHPGLISWPHHQGGWRQGDRRIWQRVDLVTELYTAFDPASPVAPETLVQALQEARIDIVVIGERERRSYGTRLDEAAFRAALPLAFDAGETVLLRVPEAGEEREG